MPDPIFDGSLPSDSSMSDGRIVPPDCDINRDFSFPHFTQIDCILIRPFLVINTLVLPGTSLVLAR